MTEYNGIANNDIPLRRYVLLQWTESPVQHTTYLHLSFTPSLSLSDSLTRVVGHARGHDLTGLKNDKKIDFVNFTLMATENYWFNCNEIYNQ